MCGCIISKTFRKELFIIFNIVKASTSAHSKIIFGLAKEIWEQHYTSIIGASQVEYMLESIHSLEIIDNEIKTGKIFYYIAYYDGNAAGYCAAEPEETQIFLSKLYIKAEYRQLGIGKSLINHIIQNFSGKEQIYLTVNKHNTGSIAIYKNMGFEIIDSVVSDIGNGYFMDDYIMRIITGQLLTKKHLDRLSNTNSI